MFSNSRRTNKLVWSTVILLVLSISSIHAQWSYSYWGINYFGKIGIGTECVQDLGLIAKGNALIVGPDFTQNGRQSILYLGDKNNSICTEWGLGLKLKAYAAPDVVIRNHTGNVGIGTTIPSAKLHIGMASGNAINIGVANDKMKTDVPMGSETGRYNINFYTWRDVMAEQHGAQIAMVRTNNYSNGNALVQATNLAFSTNTGYNDLTERMRINYLGNIGIGTSSPSEKLDVRGNLKITNSQNNGNPYITLSTENSNIQNAQWWNIQAQATDENGLLNFRTGEGPTDAICMQLSGKDRSVRIDGKLIAKEIQVKQSVWADFVFKQNYKLRKLNEVESFIKKNGHLPEIPDAKEVRENGVSVGEMQSKLLQKVEELTLYIIEMKKENDALKEGLINIRMNMNN